MELHVYASNPGTLILYSVYLVLCSKQNSVNNKQMHTSICNWFKVLRVTRPMHPPKPLPWEFAVKGREYKEMRELRSEKRE